MYSVKGKPLDTGGIKTGHGQQNEGIYVMVNKVDAGGF
jgi:hypothetical protein